MSGITLADEIVYHEEGVIATRSRSGFVIHLPRPSSAHHQLGVIAVLWNLCRAVRNEDSNEETINIELEEELSLPLIATISALNEELEQAGHKLSIVGGQKMPSLAIG